MIAKISILISIVVSMITIVLLMNLRLNEYKYEFDEGDLVWVVTLFDKDDELIYQEPIRAHTEDEAISIAKKDAGVDDDDDDIHVCTFGLFK